MNQSENRRYLIEELLKEQPRYAHMQIPADAEGQKQLLRSLMNVRMPGAIRPEFLQVQDEYLKAVAAEKGVVTLSDMEAIQPNLYIWKGDITRLKVGAIVNAATSHATIVSITVSTPMPESNFVSPVLSLWRNKAKKNQPDRQRSLRLIISRATMSSTRSDQSCRAD